MTKYLLPSVSPSKISVTISPRNHSQNSRLTKFSFRQMQDEPYFYQIESLRDTDLQQVYSFVDPVPISRTKRNLNRDFSDARMMAEVIKYYLPGSHKGLVEIHNYVDTGKVELKKQNWAVLNRKVLGKLGHAKFNISEGHVDSIVNAKPGGIERAMLMVQDAMTRFNWNPTAPPLYVSQTKKRLRHHSSALTFNGP